MQTKISAGAGLVAGLLFLGIAAHGADVPLRCCSYNITSATGAPRAGMDTVLQAIGSESVGGRVGPLDLLMMQEVQNQASTGQSVVLLMNAMYGPGVYARGNLDGATTGSGTQGVVFNAVKLQLVEEAVVGTANTSGQPRQTLRYKFHTIGAPVSLDFHVYVGHWKAGSATTDEARRLVEANAIRADADPRGNVAIIYSGDFNTYTSADDGLTRLLSAGAGQGVDPINRLGAWHDAASFIDIATQAPAFAPAGGLTGGGLDDRFDWQVVTGEVMTASASGGLTYITGSYHTFGNNGSVALNGNINDASSTALPGLPNRTTVLTLLTTVSDHLPVVADYVVYIPGACCNTVAGTCSLIVQSACVGAGISWNGAAACSPGMCSVAVATGACCTGTDCSVTTAAQCGGSYRGDNTACGAPGNPTTCCPANYNGVGGVTVQDIYDFLGAWNAGLPAADFNGQNGVSVQDIYDFLGAWNLGC